MKKIILTGISSVFSTCCLAGVSPIFLASPNLAPPSTLINGQQAATVYQITNNTTSTIDRTFADIGLTLMPAGATPDTTPVSLPYSQYCSNPFSLAPGASCLLKVDLNSSGLGTGLSMGPIVCPVQGVGVDCVQPSPSDQLNVTVTTQAIPQDCNSNTANFNYELAQPLDSTDASQGDGTAWGPARSTTLSLSPSNPNLASCVTTTAPSTSAQVSWEQQRIVAAATYWIAQKLNYCHHYNPDWATPVAGRGAAGSAGGYCNPVTDIAPGTPYYGQEARWNYTGIGSETANNWVNNNQMWYGMDCSNYTAFLYNFAFGANTALGIPFDSKTNYQAGQVGCPGNQNCFDDFLSPNQQNQNNSSTYGGAGKNYTGVYLTNSDRAGALVCVDGSVDPYSAVTYTGGNKPTLCAGHGGYLSAIDSRGGLTITVTANQLSTVLNPGDLLYIAGGGVDPRGNSNNPDGSSSEVTHVVMWTGKQVGYGTGQINPSLIAPDDICPTSLSPTGWQPQVGDWVITDSHYQGADYRVLTSCFYLNNLWGVRRVIN